MKSLMLRLSKSRSFLFAIFLIAGITFTQSGLASTSPYNGVFHHSEITDFNVKQTADINGLHTEIYRLGVTPRVVLLEVKATNTTNDRVMVADFERGYVIVNGGLKIMANGFATQARSRQDSDPMLPPGKSRHIVVAFTAPNGQDSWQASQIETLAWHPYREGDVLVTVPIDQTTAYRPMI